MSRISLLRTRSSRLIRSVSTFPFTKIRKNGDRTTRVFVLFPFRNKKVCQNESLPNNLTKPTLARYLILPTNAKGYLSDQEVLRRIQCVVSYFVKRESSRRYRVPPTLYEKSSTLMAELLLQSSNRPFTRSC